MGTAAEVRVMVRNNKPQFLETPWLRVELLDDLGAGESVQATVLRWSATAGDLVDAGRQIEVHLPEGADTFYAEHRGYARYFPDSNRWEMIGCRCRCCQELCSDGCVSGVGAGAGIFLPVALGISFQLGGVADRVSPPGGIICTSPVTSCDEVNGVTIGPVFTQGCTPKPWSECLFNFLTAQGFEPAMTGSGGFGSYFVDGLLFEAASIVCEVGGGWPGFVGIRPLIYRTTDDRWALHVEVEGDGRRQGVVLLSEDGPPACGEIDVSVGLIKNNESYHPFPDLYPDLTYPCSDEVDDEGACSLPTSIQVMAEWVAV